VDPTQAPRRGPDGAVAGRWKLLMLTSLQCEVPVAQRRLRVDRQSGAADVAASTGSALIWAERVVGWVGAPQLQRPYAGSLPALHGNPCLAHWNCCAHHPEAWRSDDCHPGQRAVPEVPGLAELFSAAVMTAGERLTDCPHQTDSQSRCHCTGLPGHAAADALGHLAGPAGWSGESSGS
jgi:hypothetical protein